MRAEHYEAIDDQANRLAVVANLLLQMISPKSLCSMQEDEKTWS